MKKIKSLLSSLLVLCFILPSTTAFAVQSYDPDIQARLTLAEEKGLTEWVDQEGYLINTFYNGKSHKDLEELEVHQLIRSMTDREVDMRVARLKSDISLFAVTAFTDMVQEGYDITGYFEVDGYVAYCVQHSVPTPGLNSPTGPPIETFNENVRKVLYYGAHGPDDRGYSYVQTAMAVSTANGDDAGNTGRRVLGEIAALPAPPAEFHAWVVTTNGGATQDLAYWTMDEAPKLGYANLVKTSANPAITDGNNCYSLAGAEYGVYTDWNSTNYVGSLWTDEWGNTNTIELNAGTYYVKGATRFSISVSARNGRIFF